MLLSDFIQARREKRIEAAKVAAKVAAKEEGRAKGRAEGIAKGRAKGIAEGRAKGRAEGEARAYRKCAEWNRRRKEAEARGEAFTEPPPTQSQEKPKE